MKTLGVFSVIAGLCIPASTFQATAEPIHPIVSPAGIATDIGVFALTIGTGTIRGKNGNNFTIRSDGGNEYLAEVVGSYLIGDYVYHSDPVNGWVEILGHAD